VLQYDTPERILADPADGFVADFIGSGAAVRRLSLTRLDALTVPRPPTLPDSADAEQRAAAAARTEEDHLLVLDDEERPVGWVCAGAPGTTAGEELPLITPLGPAHTLFDALNHMLSANATAVSVVDGDGRYRGVVGMDSLRELINSESARLREGTGRLQEA